MDVSVIIVNYNTAEITKQCIDSIIKNTHNITFEILLIDNASYDNSDIVFSEDKRITYIKSNENLGFGKANNLGFKYSKGKYIFLLNSDTIIRNNAIKIFFDYLEGQDNKIAGVGTLLKESDGKTIGNSYGQFPTLKTTINSILSIYNGKLLSIKDIKKYTKDTNEFFVDYIIGADIFLRRNVVNELGLFDPDFFMYFEETEMQYRYSKHGYRMKIYREPDIIHLECASTNKLKKKYNYNQKYRFTCSWFLYMKKTHNILYYLIFKIIMLLYLPIVVKRQNTWKQNIKLIKLFL